MADGSEPVNDLDDDPFGLDDDPFGLDDDPWFGCDDGDSGVASAPENDSDSVTTPSQPPPHSTTPPHQNPTIASRRNPGAIPTFVAELESDRDDDPFAAELESDRDDDPFAAEPASFASTPRATPPAPSQPHTKATLSTTFAAGPDSDLDEDPFTEARERDPAVDRNNPRPLIILDPVLDVALRLKTALGRARGKIRIADAQALVGVKQPSNYESCLVGRAMQRIGWRRSRCRFDGRLTYGYTKGTPYERKLILEVERRDDGHVVVKRGR